MQKPILNLAPSEASVVRAAATIFAGYTVAGKVPEGETDIWLQRSLREAYQLARLADEAIQSDSELG